MRVIFNNLKDMVILHSRSLNYPKKSIDDKSIFSGNNYHSTYNTFRYLFDKLKKGVYIIIKDNELLTYLPFSNANYVNNWSEILKDSNPQLLNKIKNMKDVRYTLQNGMLIVESTDNYGTLKFTIQKFYARRR